MPSRFGPYIACTYSTNLVRERRETPQEVTWALVTPWVVVQVQLMVLFRIPPLSSWQDLCCDASFPPLLVDLVRDIPRNLLLLGIVVKDRRSVLATDVWTLAVGRGGIVHFVEELEEGAVGYFFGVVDDLQSFRICLVY
jgi:hypothetical protein